MKKRVLALVAQNENQTLATASASLGGFFAPFGYETLVIDLLSPSGLQTLATALESDTVAFAYGFAGIGSQLQDQHNRSLWTARRVPFVSFWYDHPAYNYRQHCAASPYVLNCYHIPDHYQVWQRYLPHQNAAIFLPPPAGPCPLARCVPWAQRERRFLFAKTHDQPAKLEQSWQAYPPLLQQTLRALIAQAKADRHLDLAAATALLFAQFNEPTTNLDLFLGVVQTVDHYIRAWRAAELAQALRSYPTDIFGRGWDYLASTPGQARFFPGFPNSALWPTLMRYRLVANVNPLWREGIHERVMNGIASGAIVVTDNSERGDMILGGLPNYIGFEWTPDGIATALAKAWDGAADNAPDYLTAGEARIAPLIYNEMNFMRPLEQALRDLCARAEVA